MSRRLDAIRTAVRPKMHGRAILSGPAGAGKTWTALSMGTHLAKSADGPMLVIDTERESALTYADVFTFEHLPWRPPFDPTELGDALGSLGDRFAVVIIDSLSHFWRGQGGTLDIADGKIGGWKAARPVQEALVQSLLAVPAHVLLTVRSKMEYLIEGGKGTPQTVTKVGLAPVQDDALVYEVNVAFDIDQEHRITVTKSRAPAVPVGRLYPAGLEAKAAEDYAEWLDGGVPPAGRGDIEAITDSFGQIVSADDRTEAKREFVQLFGMPHSLTAAQVDEARSWLAARLDALAKSSEGETRPPGTGEVPASSPSDEPVGVEA